MPRYLPTPPVDYHSSSFMLLLDLQSLHLAATASAAKVETVPETRSNGLKASALEYDDKRVDSRLFREAIKLEAARHELDEVCRQLRTADESDYEYNEQFVHVHH